MARKTWIPPLVLFSVVAVLFVEQRHLIHTVPFPLTASNFRQFNSNGLRNSLVSNATGTAHKTSLLNASNDTKRKVLKRIKGPLSKSSTRRPSPVSTTRLTSEFERFGSIPSSVKAGNITSSSSCVLVAATSTGYRYTKTWLSNRRAEGIPFVLFEVNNVRMGELAAHYARIPALLATARSFPRARYLVYTDVDTLLDFRFACTRVREHPGKALSITYKMERGRRVIRTNWFVFHAWHRRAQHLLLTWLYSGRHVYLQDQTVLNELYTRKKWIRDSVQLVHRKHGLGHAEIRHCESSMRMRDTCISTLKKIVRRRSKKYVHGASMVPMGSRRINCRNC